LDTWGIAMSRCFAVICAVSLILAGCEPSEECERARVALSKTWGMLRESAAKRKLAGTDVESWSFVEERAALAESSFMTKRVTWGSADKVRDDLAQKVGSLRTDTEGNLKGFQLSLNAAFKEQDEFKAKCK
jgi:hypothetical protein